MISSKISNYDPSFYDAIMAMAGQYGAINLAGHFSSLPASPAIGNIIRQQWSDEGFLPRLNFINSTFR